MMAVKEAPSNLFIGINTQQSEEKVDRVVKRVEKNLEKQGYEIEYVDELERVIALSIRDRKQEFEELNTENSDEYVNKFVLDEIKHLGLPQVILRRDASIDASMGASVTSGDISVIPPLASGDKVLLMDKHYNIVAHGVAVMSSEEIKRSPGRVAIRTEESRYDVPKFDTHKIYNSGMMFVSTLPRFLGASLFDFSDDKANILVISQDSGEIAVHLLNQAPPGSKIYLFVKNDNHKEALEATLERLLVDPENVEFITRSLDRYAKSRPRVKFSHFYLELPSTESGKRPNPYFDMEEKTIISNARTQFSAIRSVALIGDNNAQVSYVTHSIDPTENEEVVVQAFRQGTFVPVELHSELRNKYKHGINALPEIPTVTQAG
ncbi:MAG: PUA domain-containing protein, partial [Candidatus Kariarchaeaceae archaeon]